MDLAFTEEQIMLRDVARRFLEVECPKTLVRQMETDETGHSPELWAKMADLGWLGLVLPEKYGGAEFTFQEMVILLEETGAALLPGPFFSTVVLCGQAIMDSGTDHQKETFLGGIADGGMVMALALTEPSARYDASGITLRAERSNGEYVINGTKMFVSDAQAANYLLVAARTSDGRSPQEGISLLLMDARSQGVAITPLKVMGLDKQAEVAFHDVRVPIENLLGPADGGWPMVEKLLAWGAVGKCAESVGGAQAALDMAVDYVKRRNAFGHPIGSFQAIQHYCANMLSDVESSRYLTYQAAWLVSQGQFHAPELSMAKAWISDAYHRVMALAHQCHGAIGFIKEMDLHFYYKKAKVNETLFGDAAFHWENIASAMEG